MKNIIFILSIVFLFISCLTTNKELSDQYDKRRLQEILQERMDKLSPQANILINKGYPIIISYLGKLYADSAGGVYVRVIYSNISNKDIKYVYFNVLPYNRVNDPVKCSITDTSNVSLEKIGPDKPGLINELVADYGVVWYNSTIEYVSLESIKVIFMDNTELTYDKQQSNEMIYKRNR